MLSDLTGKEGNKIIERLTGEVTSVEEYRTDYGERADRWSLLVVPALRELGAARVAELTGFSRRAVERAIRERNPSTPHAAAQATYGRVAASRRADGPRAEMSKWQPLSLAALYCHCGQFALARPPTRFR